MYTKAHRLTYTAFYSAKPFEKIGCTDGELWMALNMFRIKNKGD